MFKLSGSHFRQNNEQSVVMNAACVPCPSSHLLFTLAVKKGSAGHFLMYFGDLFVVLHVLPCCIGTKLGGCAGLSKHHWNWSTTVHCEQSEEQNHTNAHAYEMPLSTFLQYLCKNLCLNKCCPSGCLFRQKLKEKGMFACITYTAFFLFTCGL